MGIDDSFLYRCYGPGNRLLYIGFSDNPIIRIPYHRGQRWGVFVRCIKIEKYESRKMAKEAERFAIKTEKPIYNLYSNIHMWQIKTDAANRRIAKKVEKLRA